MVQKKKSELNERSRPILRAIPKAAFEDDYVPTWDESRPVSISGLNATLLRLLVGTLKFPFVWLPSFVGGMRRSLNGWTSGSTEIVRTLPAMLGLIGLVALLAAVTVLPLFVSVFFSPLLGVVGDYLPAGLVGRVKNYQGGIRGALFLWSILAICGTLFNVYSAGGWSRLLASNDQSRREI